ncbi:uncharacterized protein LOC131255054 [Magnolia sinica]|uniref:uncharacterized protein LOC131255054 n=1 Tax=Magnolia sinica TaxID=86752 RepID=UPI002658DF9B|nr:uncharacterized protein LOC131255054 [Magnolia sinica]
MQRKHNSIWVFVDRLTKAARFLPIRTINSTDSLVKLYIREVVRSYGVPRENISDRDSKFTSAFWKRLQEEMGTELKFSTTFHPQTDGQTERVIQILEDMLRARVLDFQGAAYEGFDEVQTEREASTSFHWTFRDFRSHGSHSLSPCATYYTGWIYNAFHVSMLKKYTPDESHIVSWEQIELTDVASYTEEPIRILDHKEQVLWTKIIPLVKVLWSHHGEEEATWEREAEFKEKYPHLFNSTP